MKKIIIGNWKMNPKSLGEAVKLAGRVAEETKNLNKTDIVLAPPNLYLQAVSKFAGNAKKIKLAGQNVFYEKGTGAFTGEISVTQLKTLGAGYVIVGHSERRAMGETNEIVHKKLKTVLEAGLKAVLCIGERERNKEESFSVLMRQELHSALTKIKKTCLKNLVIAYEPIWAIGTGHAEIPEHAFEIAIFIRRDLHKIIGKSIASKIAIIYGGSVSAENAGSFTGEGGMDGLLVGGASIRAKEFIKIIKEASVQTK